MNAGGTKKSLRQAFGSFKDTATVTLALVNSDYKELDIAIVRATNHVERPAKECFLKDVFSTLSATRPRADVAYCIRALAKRLSKTHNWAVALKTVIVIHRALREVDSTFQEELINYERSRTRSQMLNLAHFKDDSSPNAWDYSAWIRSYALYIEERLECFRVLKYDIETDHPRTKDLDTAELLEHLPALQQLLNRALSCQPQGAAVNNFMIKSAFSMVVSESIKIYTALKDGTVNLVDKFFEMVRQDAIKALDIYRKAGNQAERLSEFYEICKSLDYARGERFVKIEQPPVSFIQAMEDYVKEAPRSSTTRKSQVAEKVILAIECKNTSDAQESRQPSALQSEPQKEPVKVKAAAAEPIDLLGLDDPAPNATDLDEKNALAFAIVPVGDQTNAAGGTPANAKACWELAVVTSPGSNENANTGNKLGGGLDKLNLDSLYDDAIRRSNPNMGYSPWEPTRMSTPMMPSQPMHDPFFAATNSMPAARSMTMSAVGNNQQQAFMFQQQHHQTTMVGPQQQRITMMGPQQQQHQMMIMGQHQQHQQQQQMMMMSSQQQPLDHFGNSYGGGGHHYGPAMPIQAYSSFNGRV